MPAVITNTMETPSIPGPPAPEPVLGFIVSHQKVELNIDFPSQAISGHTEITILPQNRDLKILRFNARQCEIPYDGVHVNGRVATVSYEDLYKKLDIPKWVYWTAEQHEMQ